ncbi:MAG: amidohydrolase family protein, partial [Proteobacteria bacterium]|nr:amidohydrolase family protein [Pseudomonadota bacterium]
RLPPMVARFSDAFGSGLPAAEGDAERYRNTFQRSLEFVKLLHDAGVPIVPGTDAMPGFTLQHELELYSKAGISNADVLYLATLGAAKVMGHADDTGSVAPGKRADFILLDGNPLRDMREIRNVEWIVRDGRLYRAADVEKALGMLPRKD